MTANKFYFYRLIIAAFLGASMSIAIVINNYYLALASVVTAVLIIVMLKKHVKEIIVDERDIVNQGQASRYSIMIFSATAIVVIFFLLLFRDRNPEFVSAASILAYAVCSLMIINSFIFKYLQSDSEEKRARVCWITAFIALGFLLIILNLRFFSGEDDWLCQNGEWVKHGQPDFPAPRIECEK